MRRLLSFALRDRSGSVAVEFALVGPVLIGLLLGVLQIGVGMQNYNALRGISGDVARYAVINYQTANRLTETQLQDYAYGLATSPPYGLQRSRVVASVSLATNQRVSGATEFTIRLRYQVPSVLGVIGIPEVPLSYTRPIFVVS